MRLHRFMPVFPLLFAIYPVLNLYAANIEQVRFSQALRSLVILPLMSFVLWQMLNRLFSDRVRNGFFVSMLMLLCVLYGHLFHALGQFVSPLFQLRHRYFMLVYCGGIIVGMVVFVAKRKGRSWHPVVPYVNMIAAMLIAMPLLKIGNYIVVSSLFQQSHASIEQPAPQFTTLAPSPDKLPDIYYIILDGYGRDDVLHNFYGYDNTEFIEFLSSRGFYLARESHSNYAWTALSLASSLNMEYLGYVEEGESLSTTDAILSQKINDSQVLRTVHARGYAFVQFSSGMMPTDDNPCADIKYRYGFLNEFETFLGKTTFVLDRVIATEIWRKRVLFNFDELGKLQKLKTPKFVFAHFIIPHPPNLFDRNGQPLSLTDLLANPGGAGNWDSKDRYIDQVIFVNKKVEALVDQILAQSTNPPIIILQADHGPASSGAEGGWDHASQMLSHGKWDLATSRLILERMSILNAYYLPGSDANSHPYQTISPVNTFRFIFDRYLGTNLGLLEDKSYFSFGLSKFYTVPEALSKRHVDDAK